MSEAPVINLQSKQAHAQLISAFRTIGFAYVEGHDVSVQLQADLEAVARDFFARPLPEKMKYHMKNHGRSWRGYFPLGGELTSGQPDQKEGFYFGVDHSEKHPGVIKNLPTFGSNPWPDKKMKSVVTEYMSEMRRLSFQLMTLIAQGLGLEPNYFSAAFTNEPTELFRIFGYPRHTFPETADEWGVREHTDMGYLTILKQDHLGGLQAKMLNGKWLDLPPKENTFVLNIGDMLEFWTGGVLRSTPHRVRNPGQQERFSYPYFFDPHWFANLNPIEPKLLLHFNKQDRVDKRWDELELHSLSRNSTYGDFVWKKISKVFPELT